MPDESIAPRVIVEEEQHLWRGETSTKEALAAIDAEPPLTGITPQQALAQIDELREHESFMDPTHPDHATTVAKLTILYKAKGADDDKPPGPPTAEEQIAGFSNVDIDMIEAGANSLLGEGGYATIEADPSIANDPAALKLLAELGQMVVDFPGSDQDIRQHLHLSPNDARRTIAEKRDDKVFMAAYHDNAHFRHNAAVGEMQCLNLIGEGGILRWQQQQQAQPQS